MLLFLYYANCLYFTIQRGQSKCFSYDLSKKSLYIGEYEVLDQIPTSDATGDGVRVNFHEPDSRNYYTKIFSGKDRHVFNTKAPGVHKICFEGTKNLFQNLDTVRISVKMHDEAKHEKIVSNKALKSEDITEAKDTIVKLQSDLVSISSTLREVEQRQAEFDSATNDHDSTISRLSYFCMFAVILAAGVEAYLFRESMLKGTKFKR